MENDPQPNQIPTENFEPQVVNSNLGTQTNNQPMVEPVMPVTDILPAAPTKKSKKKLIIAIVVIVLIVAGLGFAGYRIYENNKDTSNSNSNSNNSKTLLSVIDINGNESFVPQDKLVFEANETLYEIGIDGTEATALVSGLRKLSGSDESSMLSNDGKYIAYFKYNEPELTIHAVATDSGNDVIVDTYSEPVDLVYNHFYGWAGDRLIYSGYWEVDGYYSIKVFDMSNNTSSVVFQTANDFTPSEGLSDVHVLNDSIVFMHGYKLTYLKLDGSSPVVVNDFSQDSAVGLPNVQLMLFRTGINTFNIGIYNSGTSTLNKYYTYSVGGTVNVGTNSIAAADFIGTFIYDYGHSQINTPESPNGKLAWLDASRWQIMVGNSDGSSAEPLTIQTDSSEVFYPYKFINDDYLIIRTSSSSENNFYVIPAIGGVPTKLSVDTANL
jgi:hypothetical protein